MAFWSPALLPNSQAFTPPTLHRMIPARRTDPNHTPNPNLDITSRLQRLRYEQRNHPQQLPPRQSPSSASTPTSPSASLHPAFAHLALDALPTQPSPPAASAGSTSRHRGTAGPSAPASWLTAEREAPERRAERAREARRRVMVPLEEGDGWLVPRMRAVPTLVELCGRAVVGDLARGRRGSVLMEYVRWLPARLRVPLVELAPVKGDVGLGQAAIRELLSEESEEEGDAWADDEERDGPVQLEEQATPLDPSSPQPRDQAGDPDGWEHTVLTAPLQHMTIASTLTRLDLSLSTLTHTTLAALLLTSPPGPPTSTPTPRPTPTPTFPHLSSLSLSASPRLSLSEPLLDLLSPLLSLRHLALACLPLADPFTPSTVLPKLATATPTLESVDLSFVPGLSAAVLKNVNWDVRWRELRVVGWRRWLFVAEGPERGREVGRARKDEVARELWGVVRGARREKGRFIKFVT